MVTDEFFSDADIGVADLRFCNLKWFFPLMSFLQVFALEGTSEGDFALGSTAECADIAAYCRTDTAGPALLADLTENRLRHSL